MLSSSICLTQEPDEVEIIAQVSEKRIQESKVLPIKVTLDCGVQASLNNPESNDRSEAERQEAQMKKRKKRQEYKKRKKLKLQLMQRQNREEFKSIIDMFYEKDAKFIHHSERLEDLVCSFNQNEFKDIFDAILKERVDIIQSSIWEFTHQASQAQRTAEEKSLGPIQYDSPFFHKIVDYIYKYFQIIEKSSREAEQVIYIYLTLNAKDSEEAITPQDLGRRTFRYMVETDKSLRNSLRRCDLNIPLVRYPERAKLQIMIRTLKNFREKFDQIDYEEDSYDEEDYNDPYGEDLSEVEEDESICNEPTCPVCLRKMQLNGQNGALGNTHEDQKSTAMSENSEDFEDLENHEGSISRGSFDNKNAMLKRVSHMTEIDLYHESIFRRLEDMNISSNDNRRPLMLDMWENSFLDRMKEYQTQFVDSDSADNSQEHVFTELHDKLSANLKFKSFTKEFAYKFFG